MITGLAALLGIIAGASIGAVTYGYTGAIAGAAAGGALAYALVFAIGFIFASVSARHEHRIVCPELSAEAVVVVDRRKAAQALFNDEPQRVVDCSLWKGLSQPCGRTCQTRIEL